MTATLQPNKENAIAAAEADATQTSDPAPQQGPADSSKHQILLLECFKLKQTAVCAALVTLLFPARR
jgi:hypothetical protein